jgi:hypothetical protein
VVNVQNPAHAGRAIRRGLDRAFYVGMSLAAVATVFAGFARTYFLRSHFWPTPLPLYLHVHGLVFTAWIALFVAQTMLIATRRTDIHRRLGWAVASLAVVMVAAAVTAAILSGRRDVAAGHEDAALTFLTTPLLSMLVFLVLAAAAVYHRRRPEIHKRLMLLATISILDAAVARWPIALVSATPWAYFVLTDVFIVIAAAYDLSSRKRVHPVYMWAGLLVLAGQFSRDIVGRTAAWHAFGRHLIG